MKNAVLLGGLLFLVGIMGCQSSDRKKITLQNGEGGTYGTGDTLAAFSSERNDSVQIELLLYTDSAFHLHIQEAEKASDYRLRGSLRIAENYYQLFFPDTITRLNELITSGHSDASVVVYPDHSVALDKALTQFYVRGIEVTRDTTDMRR